MTPLHEQAQKQATFLNDWFAELQPLSLSSLAPQRTAFTCVDVIEGFHRIGPLASPRVEKIIPAVVNLTQALDTYGVPHERFAFIQDAHPTDAQEFTAYPSHCVIGSQEAEAVKELKALPNWQHYQHFTKNAIASHSSAAFEAWLDKQDVDVVIAVGDVTDLCLFSLALHLQTRNLARGLGQRIVVPESCVQTWDAPGHPGDLYHVLFLHQLARNGVEVVASIEP